MKFLYKKLEHLEYTFIRNNFHTWRKNSDHNNQPLYCEIGYGDRNIFVKNETNKESINIIIRKEKIKIF